MRSSPRSFRAFLGEEGTVANASVRVDNGSVEPLVGGGAYLVVEQDGFRSIRMAKG
jgi:hypothetical protein